MKTYKIPTVQKIDWLACPVAHITDYVMSECRPLCDIRMLCLRGESIVARLTCHEENPRAEHRNFGDLVCQDSCMEFFFGFVYDSDYVNCEMNAIGTTLAEFGGKDGAPRASVDGVIPHPAVRSFILPHEWTVEVTWELSSLRKLFGDDIDLAPGRVFYGNFFKCGDRTASRHFGSWDIAPTEGPTFHDPEFFGKFIIND